jgi:hypothetical protein
MVESLLMNGRGACGTVLPAAGRASMGYRVPGTRKWRSTRSGGNASFSRVGFTDITSPAQIARRKRK